jgi:hypothetical protein
LRRAAAVPQSSIGTYVSNSILAGGVLVKRADGRQLSVTVASPQCCFADGNTITRPSRTGGQPQPSHELTHIL